MKVLYSVTASIALFAAFQVNADEPIGRLTMAQKQQMTKECMGRQKQKNDGRSQSEMKQTCMEELNKPKDPSEHVGSGAPDRPPNSQ